MKFQARFAGEANKVIPKQPGWEAQLCSAVLISRHQPIVRFTGTGALVSVA
jgi:hypothetical protein